MPCWVPIVPIDEEKNPSNKLLADNCITNLAPVVDKISTTIPPTAEIVSGNSYPVGELNVKGVLDDVGINNWDGFCACPTLEIGSDTLISSIETDGKVSVIVIVFETIPPSLSLVVKVIVSVPLNVALGV